MRTSRTIFYPAAVAGLLAVALIAGFAMRDRGDVATPATETPAATGTAAAPAPTGSPASTASGAPCADGATSSSAIPAAYPSGLLDQRQRNVTESAVGTEQVVPHLAAFAYFGDAGIAGQGNVVGWSERGSPGATFVNICLRDGSRIRAEMFQPFPAEARPIWAVRVYQRS